MKLNILITGGSGFIGGRLREALSARHQVFYTARSPSAESPPGLLQGDLTDEIFARDCSAGMDAIIHCAGMAGTWGDYDSYYRANVVATRFLVAGAKDNGVKRLINISSPSIYFDFKDQLDLREDFLPRQFSNAYAHTKYEAEVIIQSAHAANLQTVSLRPRSVIGRGDRNVLPRLMRLQQTGNLVQVGDGHNVVDITTIGNLIHAVELCLTAEPSALGQVYNISNGQPERFWDFVDQVLAAARLPNKRKHLPLAPVMAVARMNDWVSRLARRRSEPALLPIAVGIIAYSMTMDISKARRLLGYNLPFSTQDGINEFFGFTE